MSLWDMNVSRTQSVILAKSKKVTICLPGLDCCWALVAQILLLASVMMSPNKIQVDITVYSNFVSMIISFYPEGTLVWGGGRVVQIWRCCTFVLDHSWWCQPVLPTCWIQRRHRHRLQWWWKVECPGRRGCGRSRIASGSSNTRNKQINKAR